jgi:hypothetical protein
MLLTFPVEFAKYGAWPLAALIFLLILTFSFRERIGRIIDKIGPAIDRLKKVGPLELTSGPQSQQPVNLPAESLPKILHPLETPVLTAQEEAIRKDVEKLFPNDLSGRVNSLVTHLAATQMALAFEMINKLIWGSQLELLLHVNSLHNGAAVDELKRFYDKAAAAHQDGLKEYPFENYVGFLINSRLLVRTNGRVLITPFAKEFLAHLARTGATYPRPL